MARFLLLLAAAAGVGGCSNPSTYSIQAPTMSLADDRAIRYCDEQDANARFEGVRSQGDGEVEVYSCVAR